MSEQATWVPLPKRRVKAARLSVVIGHADRLIDWYLLHKPAVKHLAVSRADYNAFKEHVGHSSIVLDKQDRLKYRGFVLYVAP